MIIDNEYCKILNFRVETKTYESAYFIKFRKNKKTKN